MGYINDQGEYVNSSRSNGNSNGNIFVRMTRFIIVKQNGSDTTGTAAVNQRSTLIAGLIAFVGIATAISMMLKGSIGGGVVGVVLSLLTAFLYEFIARKKGLLTFLVCATLFYIGFDIGGDLVSAAVYGAIGWGIGMLLEKMNNIKYRK